MTQVASGFQLNYTDPSSGITILGAWMQIRQINYSPYQSCLVVADVYQNQASYQSGLAPVFYNVAPIVNVDSSDWNNYFDPYILRQANHDIQTQGLTWLQTKY